MTWISDLHFLWCKRKRSESDGKHGKTHRQSTCTCWGGSSWHDVMFSTLANNLIINLRLKLLGWNLKRVQAFYIQVNLPRHIRLRVKIWKITLKHENVKVFPSFSISQHVVVPLYECFTGKFNLFYFDALEFLCSFSKNVLTFVGCSEEVVNRVEFFSLSAVWLLHWIIHAM